MTWPIKNRSDSLTIDFFYLRRMVSHYLYADHNYDTLDDEQINIVDESIDDGCRLYYFPPQLVQPYSYQTGEVHEWSFMRPTFEFDTQANQRYYPLPEDFERPVGPVAFRNNDTTPYSELTYTSPSRLRVLENRLEITAVPTLFAIFHDETQGDAPQQITIGLHPTPDAKYLLRMQYQSTGRKLTEQHPYPMGGQIHGRGILYACLAAAELRKTGVQGPMWQHFMNTLASNVVRDQNRMASILGYNGNMANEVIGRGDARRLNLIWHTAGLYDGVLYDGS